MKHCKFIGLCVAFRDLILQYSLTGGAGSNKGAVGCVWTASRWCLEVENSSTLCVAFTERVRIWEEQKNSG